MPENISKQNTAPQDRITPLMFGVPQLDELLGYHAYPGDNGTAQCGDSGAGNPIYDSLRSASSMAVVGEDGTGKSIFALHLAATYAALHYRARESGEQVSKNAPRVIYASSDYRFEAAETVWKKFYLDFPWLRYIPGLDEEERQFRTQELELLTEEGRNSRKFKPNHRGLKVNLARCELDKIAEKLLDNPKPEPKEVPDGVEPGWREYQVNFIDLARESSGDDWRFITSLVASFPRRDDEPPSLLVMDSVAGFETFIGKTNTFGEESSRRSRVSQLLRTAGESWHVVFIAEEPDQIRHHPEEYVTDTVFHLYRTGTQEKVRRFLEIEKSRARNFAQGEHEFDIRDGSGTSTKSWENPDDLETILHPTVLANLDDEDRLRNRKNAHIQVFPSLHYLSKRFGRRHSLLVPSKSRSSGDRKPFGIKYLDDMLCSKTGDGRNKGLRPSTATALIGEEGTRKTELAEQFLFAAYDDLPEVVNLFLEISKKFRARPQPEDIAKHKSFKDFVIQEIGRRFPEPNKPAENEPAPMIKRLRGCVTRFVASAFDLQELELIANGNFKLWDPTPYPGPPQSESSKKVGETKTGPSQESSDCAPFKPRWNLRVHAKEYEENETPDERSTTMALAFSALRLPIGALAPTVFIATHDASSENLAKRIIDRHRRNLADLFKDKDYCPPGTSMDDCMIFLRRVLETWITVRRAELADCTAPHLWHVIESAAIQGMTRLGYNASELRLKSEPSYLTDQVRVIISDLRLLRETYPAIVDDSLFLATVVFRLRRYGVTTLIVESDNGRLNQSASHPMSGALRSLVDHQINTWKVNFFGAERVAITVLPSSGTSSVSLIRELRFAEPSEPESESMGEAAIVPLIVDPLFEMFENIEEGSPRAIPLRIQLYGETHAFEQYVKSEKEAFQLVFAPELPLDSVVLRVAATTDYQAFRDYAHLPTGRRLPFSLVMMVDGFWALGRKNTLQNQWDYLFGHLPGPKESRFEDPFRLFMRDSKAGEPLPHRTSFFRLGKPDSELSYQHRIDRDFKGIDRVPFMWDFGFLLCNYNQWKNAAKCKLRKRKGIRGLGTVGDVFSRMKQHTDSELLKRCTGESNDNLSSKKANSKAASRHLGGARPDHLSWRDFFEACTLVAATEEKRTGKPCQPFDVAMTTPDLLGCLLFEIWFSEIYKDILRFRDFVEKMSAKNAPEAVLKEITKWTEKAERFLLPVMSDKYLYHRDAQSDLKDALVSPQPGKPSEPREPWNTDAFEGWDKSKRWDSKNLKLICTQDEKKVSDLRDKENEPAVLERFLLVKANNGYSLHLYQAWLLLLEVMDFRAFEACQWSFELACNRSPDPSAPAVRHWYKTACAATKSDQDATSPSCCGQKSMIPVRLPGYFTVRGDWFLATAQGSRSERLAAQAIDLLSSRRANRTRLHLGLGLPVRDLTADDQFHRLRTGITLKTPTGIYRPVCEDILGLGGCFLWEVKEGHAGWRPAKEDDPDADKEVKPQKSKQDTGFYWLFRSGMRDYDRQAVVISRWIQRLFEWTVQVRFEQADKWKGRFEEYDGLEAGSLNNCKDSESWKRFYKVMDTFLSDLNASTQGAETPARY